MLSFFCQVKSKLLKIDTEVSQVCHVKYILIRFGVYLGSRLSKPSSLLCYKSGTHLERVCFMLSTNEVFITRYQSTDNTDTFLLRALTYIWELSRCWSTTRTCEELHGSLSNLKLSWTECVKKGVMKGSCGVGYP